MFEGASGLGSKCLCDSAPPCRNTNTTDFAFSPTRFWFVESGAVSRLRLKLKNVCKTKAQHSSSTYQEELTPAESIAPYCPDFPGIDSISVLCLWNRLEMGWRLKVTVKSDRRQRTAALQNLSEMSAALSASRSVLECGSLLPLSAGKK